MKRNTRSSLLASALAAGLLTSGVAANALTFDYLPIGDTYVQEVAPDDPTDGLLLFTRADGTNTSKIYLKFDLSTLPVPLADVTSVTLFLRNADDPSVDSGEIVIWGLQDDYEEFPESLTWNESVASYGNDGSTNSMNASMMHNGVGLCGFVPGSSGSTDICTSSYLLDFIQNSGTDHRFALALTGGYNGDGVATAWESSEHANAPTLRITAVPEPGTLLLFGMGAAGLATFRRRD